MGKVFVIIGASCSGKDTLFKLLKEYYGDKLKSIVLYTTRPIRENEENGIQYHFINETQLKEMEINNQIIERRDYNTINGKWTYLTASNSIDLSSNYYIMINTIEGYKALKAYYGEDKIIPIYINAKPEIRLERAIKRELKQKSPNYQEVARRFIADCNDFNEQTLSEAGITNIFDNNNNPANPNTWSKTKSLEIVRDEIINTIDFEIYCKEKKKI